jgi:hypothetical protein
MSKFKPQNLGLIGEFTPEEYATKLKAKIKTAKMPSTIKAYLLVLIDYMLASNQKKTALAKELNQWYIKPIRQKMESDFSEVIQPLFIVRGNIAQAYGIELGNTPKILIEADLSQRVYDFTIVGRQGTKYRFSSKAGTSKSTKTNTVKFKDVYDMLHEENPAMAAKMKNSWQMKVFEKVNKIPARGGTWNTSVAAMVAISENGVAPFKGIVPSMDEVKLPKGELDEQEFLVYNKILRKVPSTKVLDAPTGTSVAYASETLLSKWSETRPNDWNPLFNASMVKVYTIRTSFPNNAGLPSFEIVKPGKYNVKIGVKARGPVGDHKDAIGFEIK